MSKRLVTRIILRNDTKANWLDVDPVLLKGELGLEIDTNKFKRGDGISMWSALPYFSHLESSDYVLLKQLIEKLNDDEFGKVDDVQVNNTSVLDAETKTAKIVIGDLTIDGNAESFTGNIVLHKVAKTGSYNDLVDKLTVIDNLDSTSTTDPLSANQGSQLKKMVQALPTAQSYTNIQSMITALNSYSNTELNVGANLYLQQLGVPDYWVYSRETTNVPYTYTDDSAFITAVQTEGSVQVGYYKVSLLETAKVDLSNYYTKTEVDELLSNIDLTDYIKYSDFSPFQNGYIYNFDAPSNVWTDSIGTGFSKRYYKEENNSWSTIGGNIRFATFVTSDFDITRGIHPDHSSSYRSYPTISLKETVLKSTDSLILDGGTSVVETEE